MEWAELCLSATRRGAIGGWHVVGAHAIASVMCGSGDLPRPMHLQSRSFVFLKKRMSILPRPETQLRKHPFGQRLPAPVKIYCAFHIPQIAYHLCTHAHAFRALDRT